MWCAWLFCCAPAASQHSLVSYETGLSVARRRLTALVLSRLDHENVKLAVPMDVLPQNILNVKLQTLHY